MTSRSHDRRNFVLSCSCAGRFSRSVFAKNLCARQNFVLLTVIRSPVGMFSRGRGWWVAVVVALCHRRRAVFCVVDDAKFATCGVRRDGGRAHA